jgi:hypothetical protein
MDDEYARTLNVYKNEIVLNAESKRLGNENKIIRYDVVYHSTAVPAYDPRLATERSR